MSGPTPGPWSVDGNGRIYCQQGLICVVDQPEVNASFIAAAPKMFETLRQIAIGVDADGHDLNRADMMVLAAVAGIEAVR